MPDQPTAAESAASRANGARSTGPVTDAGKARASLNATRHGLCGRAFFLLPDEDEADWRQHEALWLATWAPRDALEHEAALAAIRAMWREIRADRLEVVVLGDLFAAGRIADPAEREAAKSVAFKALGTLLRYRGRIEREHRQARQELDALRQRVLRPVPAARPSEPERASPPALTRAVAPAAEPPPRPLNRQQRRALAALERRAA
jgi:hypothetical protein